MWRFMAMIIIILFPGAIYFLLHFKKLSFIDRLNKPTWLPWAIASVMTLICAYMVHAVLELPAAIVLFILYSFIISDILNLIIKKWVKQKKLQENWRKVNGSGTTVLVFTGLIICVSYLTAIHVVKTNYDIYSDKRFGNSTMKISLISDIHLGTSVNLVQLKKYCDEIQASNPDILVIDGDAFDENTPKGYMEAACKLLGEIKTTYGIYYVFGNHEKGIHGILPYFTTEEVKSNLVSNNISVLDDSTKLVNNMFYIVGRKDASIDGNASRSTLNELLTGVDKNKFILLLDHQPLELESASGLGVDLQLSGHTHGGQIWPTGPLISMFNKNGVEYGYKSIGNYQIIVTSGLGAWNYPLRLGSKAEIVTIQLHLK
ncbi:MAG: metallophosphoesterase [Solirubrobacterales bacterium]